CREARALRPRNATASGKADRRAPQPRAPEAPLPDQARLRRVAPRILAGPADGLGGDPRLLCPRPGRIRFPRSLHGLETRLGEPVEDPPVAHHLPSHAGGKAGASGALRRLAHPARPHGESEMKNTAQRLRVAEGKGEKAPAPKRTVPCMQTTWPHMLFPRIAATVPLVFPFDQPGLRYRYFARNAVWDAVQLLGLAGKKVLMPAYHHGVELETLLAAGVQPVFFRVTAQIPADFYHARATSAGPAPRAASHLIGSMLSNLELRTGEVGRRTREALRNASRWFVRRANVERVSIGTQHFNIEDVDLGMSAASHLVLRNQDTASIVERRRRNYFLLYAMLRDVAPPVTGELKPGVCPLFYPMAIEDKAGAMARLLARGVDAVA